MIYKIEVYENPFDRFPRLSKFAEGPLEAEAAIRNITEKFNEMNEECIECGQVGSHNNSCVKSE